MKAVCSLMIAMLLSGLAPLAVCAESSVKVIAHRGGKVWAPENTMEAFRLSLALDVDGIELDIHRCKSGELVVIHDETIDRTTNGSGLVKELTFDQLQKYSAGLWFSKKFKSEKVPLLKDVLNLIDGKTHLFIEVKNAPVEYAGLEHDLKEILETYKHKDKITVISFDHQFLKKFHRVAPRYTVGFLDVAIVSDIGKYAQSIGAKAWNPGFGEIRKDAVANAQKSGLSVNPWTVNGKKDWLSAIDMGVDGIITDDPEGLMKLIKRNGQKLVK